MNINLVMSLHVLLLCDQEMFEKISLVKDERFVCACSTVAVFTWILPFLAKLVSPLISVTSMFHMIKSSCFILFGMIVVNFYIKVSWNKLLLKHHTRGCRKKHIQNMKVMKFMFHLIRRDCTKLLFRSVME